MKKFALDLMRRGLVACGFGPIVLAVIYLILQRAAVVVELTADQVCVGIFSLAALAFLAGGMNAIYQIERLPLMVAIFIHGSVLYVGYLATYLVNDWLAWGTTSILVFTAIFVVGYLIIWLIVYSIIRKNINRMNEVLKKKQEREED